MQRRPVNNRGYTKDAKIRRDRAVLRTTCCLAGGKSLSSIEMDLSSHEQILTELLAPGPHRERAWKQFLESYSRLFLKVIWELERDKDEVMEQYLHVCSKFAENSFAVLRAFKRDYGANPPKFTTWLRAVTRNMIVDRHRSIHGRKRFPKALLQLSPYARKVFDLYYWQGYSLHDIDHFLEAHRNGSSESVADLMEEIRKALLREPPSPEVQREPTVLRYNDELGGVFGGEEDIPAERLELWLSTLEPRSRLILRLRFWENMPASEIARILRIVPEKHVYKIIDDSLKQLRLSAEHEESS